MKYRISSGIRAMARHLQWVLPTALAVTTTVVSMDAAAVPAFARQTGQNCQACHVGGQFPELTPYGRLFKLTGFTLGQRASVPLAIMGVFTAVQNPGDRAVNGSNVTNDGALTFATSSLFFGGKLTDSIGALAQYTWNNAYNNGQNNTWFPLTGTAGSDNTDFRYAQHITNGNNDLIFGVSVNNNPGVEDVWNSSAAWGYNTVPGSFGSDNSISPILNQGLAQQAVGAGAYVYWNRTVYAEVSGYRTGDGVFSFLTQGIPSSAMNYISGTAPYVRLALTHDWGNSNAMIGYTYFAPDVYEGNLNGGPYDAYRDNMVDFQYQYILDPNTVTVELSDINETVNYGSAAGSAMDTNSLFRAKASYTYEAKYGVTLLYSNGTNNVNPTSPVNTLQYGSTAWTPEVFWIPIQNVRIGYQYTIYTSLGDIAGQQALGTMPVQLSKPGDYNTSFFYVWAAF